MRMCGVRRCIIIIIVIIIIIIICSFILTNII